ncbi:putative small secreted protein [Constrictibacter sp. MBR-5]|jgi:predicted small secreted protein
MTILRRLGTVALLALMPTLAGCNTVEGVGRDVQATGKAIERTAR